MDELAVDGAAVEEATQEFVASFTEGFGEAALVILKDGFDALAFAGVVGEHV